MIKKMIKTLKSIINNLNSERNDLIIDCLRKISKKSTLDDTDREFLEYLANSIEKERNQTIIHAKWNRYDEEYINNLQGIDKEIFDLFQTLSNSEKRKYLKQLHRLLKR